ncbi:ABC transporter ATP-binding protein [Nocardiopsis gilva YIM 90087]|uniref:ABC transporter ATP-binding protein n=1 Tax=Nocardiopsis gilva YIM 90087 TaxID=1235441 RepID=A0A223SBM0_9ACTN|nr:ABC transporter ATP-binding protein [Nocardiopsis gilva]ASU85547.1 ABC transporter ATP-binding protein [Nocardiopsis gilva YIM 90087]
MMAGGAGVPHPDGSEVETPVLEIVGATRVHGQGPTEVVALDGVDLEVRAGELVAVMGPSGSGKSTLLNLAGGLDTPTAGSIRVVGEELSGLGATARARLRRRLVGYVFQDFNLVPSLTAAENVALPLELDGVPARRAGEQAIAALDSVGVGDLADRFPEEMSGGQQQRTAVARALVGPRRLLLADEPTGALDTATGEEMMLVLRGRIDAGSAGVLVTHDARYAAWADRTVFLRDGRLTGSTGTRMGVESLFTTPGAPPPPRSEPEP